MKLLIVVACLAMAACGASTEDTAKKAEARETPLDPLTEPLDRARAVEDTVEQHQRDLDDAIGKAEDERPWAARQPRTGNHRVLRVATAGWHREPPSPSASPPISG